MDTSLQFHIKWLDLCCWDDISDVEMYIYEDNQ